jgi:acetyl/propionyl-CoA carboxylase alpha subunit
MIKQLLVANRGEIAVRIMATASVLGIETVAVYAADDAACGHVSRADAAVELPGTGAAAYLDVDAVVAAATGTGCDTLHPGYGFASERPQLAARCAEAGVRFAGPAPDALALFGDKGAARARARELGVPVLAGTDGDTSLDEARACSTSTRSAVRPAQSPTEASRPGWLALASPRSPLRLSDSASVWGCTWLVQPEPYRPPQSRTEPP